jgi:RNase adaptor protein for sRNA GlmZ degradation
VYARVTCSWRRAPLSLLTCISFSLAASPVPENQLPSKYWRTPTTIAWTTFPRSCCRSWSSNSISRAITRSAWSSTVAAATASPSCHRNSTHCAPGDLELQLLFLDAQDDTLIKRYSETRRRHPLASDRLTLTEAIAEERVHLAGLSAIAHHMDTSVLKPSSLREWVRQFIATDDLEETGQGLALLFESFGFKNGIPLDADLVFDVRCLPNPYYEASLRALTGRDVPVISFLEAEAEVLRMRQDIAGFVRAWLPAYVSATVAIT